MSERTTDTSRYRAVWRWHFYAGLLTLPVLGLLAVTGAIYLFQPELDRVIYRSYMEVPARGAPAVAPTVAAQQMETALDGRVLQLQFPAEPHHSVVGIVRVASGEARTVYADPYDGHVIGSTPFNGVMQTVRKLHSLQLFGFWASSIVEAAAGWTIILVITGIVLWWPRGRSGGVVTIRETPKRRTFWRDLHAVTGLFSGVFIVFLALSGMPWSMFWGAKVQGWASARNLGQPAPPAEVTPAFLLGVPRPDLAAAPRAHHETPRMVPWALEQSPVPASAPVAAQAGVEIGLDSAVTLFTHHGLALPFGVQLPEGPRGAYTATQLDGRTSDARTVYLDQYSGAVLGDVGFEEYGGFAQTVEWGIAVHTGKEYGAINRALMLAACLAILVLVISAPVMWWKRRPAGGLGAPPAPTDKRTARAVMATIVLIGLIFPLVGLSLVGALLVDAGVSRMSVARAGR